MGGKTDAGIAPKQTIMVWRFHFMTENYEADLLNENHSKYKSGVQLFGRITRGGSVVSQVMLGLPAVRVPKRKVKANS